MQCRKNRDLTVMIQSIDRWRQSTWCCEPLQIKKKKSALLGISQYLKFFFFLTLHISPVRNVYFLGSAFTKMSQQRGRCSVVGCRNEHKSVHLLPSSVPLKMQWISFIFKGNAPENVDKYLYVCANHFTPDCFVNEGQ